jgi:hypothetical protein
VVQIFFLIKNVLVIKTHSYSAPPPPPFGLSPRESETFLTTMRMVHFGQDGGTEKFKPQADDVLVTGFKAFVTNTLLEKSR